MDEQFSESIPNASVMVRDVSIQEAIRYKQELSGISGVTTVLWLDDVIDIKEPLEVGDTDTIEEFYKDGNALFSVTIADGMEKETTAAIRDLIGEENALAGDASDTDFLQQATESEALKTMAIIIPVFILILILSTSSWIEPALFLGAVGASVIINMGTNAFLGDISFMTNSVSPILQLAVSLDYAVFLMHSFASNRKKYSSAEEAMRVSIKESFSTVAASASTTFFGFLALVFMDFGIGADLGFALVKGIILSFLTVMVFLPAITIYACKLIDRTRHRQLMPNFRNANKVLSKLFIPVMVLVLIILVPCFLGQSRADFTYGSPVDPESRTGLDRADIEEVFGRSTIMALMVPRGDVAKEENLCRDIQELDHVTSIISYATSVGNTIPAEFLDESITGQFYSENYARIIIYTDTANEGDIAFKTVEDISGMAESYYGDTFYTAGQSANMYDMKNVVQKDNILTSAIAIIAIFIVLLLTFRSAVLPFILLITIEAAIWINLAIPYFTGTPISYMGYLIINTVQLGATVDYAILLTVSYMRNRQLMGKKEAMSKSLGTSFKSILISAVTLSSAGFVLYLTSSNPVISMLGLLLGRGTLLSVAMVVCFLPALLLLLDKVIGKTTYRSGFLGLENIKREKYKEIK